MPVALALAPPPGGASAIQRAKAPAGTMGMMTVRSLPDREYHHVMLRALATLRAHPLRCCANHYVMLLRAVAASGNACRTL